MHTNHYNPPKPGTRVRCPGCTSLRGGGHAVRGHTYPVQYCACTYIYTCDRDTVCKRTVPQHPYSRRGGYPKVPPAWPKPVVWASHPNSRHAYPVQYCACAYIYTCDRDTVYKHTVPQCEIWIAYTKIFFARLAPRFR